MLAGLTGKQDSDILKGFLVEGSGGGGRMPQFCLNKNQLGSIGCIYVVRVRFTNPRLHGGQQLRYKDVVKRHL